MQIHRTTILVGTLIAVTAVAQAIPTPIEIGWKHILGYTAHNNFAFAAAQDSQKSLYLASRIQGGNGAGDVSSLVKFNGFGQQMWVHNFPLPSFGRPDKVLCDNSGHVFLANNKYIGAGSYELDLYCLDATTGNPIYGRGYKNSSSIDAVGLAIDPATGNVLMDLAVGATAPPYGNFLRTVTLTQAGGMVKVLDHPEINPQRVFYTPNGNREAFGGARLMPTGSAIFEELSPVGDVNWTRTTAGSYNSATKTQTNFTFSAAYDPFFLRLFLGTARSIQVNGGTPTVQSWVQTFNSSHTLVATSPILNLNIYSLSADGGLTVAGAGTDAAFTHTVLQKIGSSPFTLPADNMRDFCCHEGQLFESTVDAPGTGLGLTIFDGAGTPGPFFPFPNAGGGHVYGGDLFSQPDSYAVIGSMSQGGRYAPCAMTVREGPDLMSVDIPSILHSGQQAMLKVTSNAPAPMGGIMVSLSSSTLQITNSTILIPAGATSATTMVKAPEVAVDTNVSVIAHTSDVLRADSGKAAAAKVIKIELPETVKGGNLVPVTVTLDGAAPKGGLTVTFASDSGGAIASGQTGVIDEGGTTGVIFLDSKTVKSDTKVTITATDANGGKATATVTITK